MKKFKVLLQIGEVIGSSKFKSLTIENKTTPRIIDGRLVFFEKSLEIFVINKGEWIFWREI